VIEAAEFTLPEALFKTIDHFAPNFWAALAEVTDPRNPLLSVYPLHQELLVAVLASMMKMDARRDITYRLDTPAFVSNMLTLLKRLYPNDVFADSMFHGDTLNYVLKGVSPLEIGGLRTLVIRSLLRKRCLDDFRLRGLYYPVAVDGTGALVFRDKHCGHCLRKTSKGKTIYYHPAVEAKFVLANGLALSVGTEFPENEHPDVKKQDCELKAFYRLAKTLKKDFPQTRLCLLLDGLFANSPVVKLCEHNRWAYIITLKEGSLPAVFGDYEALLTLTPENVRVVESDGCRRTYRWINDVEFGDRTVNVFECFEETSEGTTRFVWLTGFRVETSNVEELSERGGRQRWKIENEGFNTQKNGGYGLEHAFSENNVALKNFYLLMQIGHIFNQLMEKGSLLRERIRVTMGSLKVFSQKLWAVLTETVIDEARLLAILECRIQIRFETG
jgi:hypothetical protein